MQTYSFCSIMAENSMPGLSILTYRSANALDNHPPNCATLCNLPSRHAALKPAPLRNLPLRHWP